MSKAKTVVDISLVEVFLKSRFDFIDGSLQRVTGGEMSQAFFFDCPQGQRVIRINKKHTEGFLKDQYAALHFSSAKLPIPKVLEIGQFDEQMSFAISERCPGKSLDKFSHSEVHSFLPKVIEALEAVHNTELDKGGYGWWRTNGSGKYQFWHQNLIDSMRQPDDHLMLSIDFYNQKLHKQLQKAVHHYLQYCPEERKLIHADFGYENVICDGYKITGVIDWENSMYGDPLYDVAWLEFWRNDGYYESAFKEHYIQKGGLPKKYQSRILCYKLLIGQNVLCFFAKSEQKAKYLDSAQTATKLLESVQ